MVSALTGDKRTGTTVDVDPFSATAPSCIWLCSDVRTRPRVTNCSANFAALEVLLSCINSAAVRQNMHRHCLTCLTPSLSILAIRCLL